MSFLVFRFFCVGHKFEGVLPGVCVLVFPFYFFFTFSDHLMHERTMDPLKRNISDIIGNNNLGPSR